MKKYGITLIILMAILSCNSGGSPKITVTGAKIVPSPIMIGVASAFMKIANDGKGSDRLTGCSIKEFPSVQGMLHDYVDGKMTMVAEIEVPFNKITELRSGGLHLMFSGLPEKLENPATMVLNFKNSGTIEVRAGIPD